MKIVIWKSSRGTLMNGKIIKILSNDYTIKLDNNDIITCKARGVFRNQNITLLAGDKVIVDVNKKIIEKNRKNIRKKKRTYNTTCFYYRSSYYSNKCKKARFFI